LREALVDAWHGGERLTTLRSGQPFAIQAYVLSEFFPVTSAQVRLSVMSRLPGAAANKDGFGYQLWKEITVDPTTNLATFTNLTVEEIPLPAGSNWGLLHLWIEIDPDNLIPETNDTGDNVLRIDNWIPFCNDNQNISLDTLVGAHLGTEEFDGTGTLGYFSPNSLSTSVNLGYGSLFMEYNPGTNGTNPFIGWRHDQGGSIGGVMVRYIRPHHGNQASELRIGVANGVNPANPDLSEGGGALEVNGQWHTIVWQRENEPPFGHLTAPDIADLDLPVLSSKALLNNAVFLDMGPDTGCWGGTPCGIDSTYPPTYVDFVRVWYNGPPPDPNPELWNAFPAGLMVKDGVWSTLEGEVIPGEPLNLGLKVGGIGAHPVDEISISRTENYNTESSATYEMTAGAPEAIGGGFHVFPLSELPGGAFWTPSEGTQSANFDIDLEISDSLEDDSDNTATYDVTVQGTTTPLQCPVPTTVLR
ncbi:MAG: hypothetical protein GY832_16435, partial [Chloroflexi bacterium]|nr:hypothetical protein [Chloroflexota bacterium]